MTLISSISGTRGTIGGEVGSNLTPPDIVRHTSAYALWLCATTDIRKVVIGRDARISGPIVEKLVTATLMSWGFDVLNLGLSTTPTVEMAVPYNNAAGGIILTASHNGREWNALKLLNSRGEFVTKKEGAKILHILENGYYNFNKVDTLGKETFDSEFIDYHLDKVVTNSLVDAYAIKKRSLKVVVDGINSSGGVVVPKLLRLLGVEDIVEVNCEPNGEFAHDPEPLAKNLAETCRIVVEEKANLGIVVDPDVDRLVFIQEDGTLFGEEYTLVAIADYVLGLKKGSVVSNLSSSRALKDVADKYGCPCFSSAVGEVNVIEKMKRHDSVLGGEGNGGVILPDLHYGRDALIGIGLFLTHFVQKGLKMSELRDTYPNYFMAKEKVRLTAESKPDDVLEKLLKTDPGVKWNTTDGLKADFEKSWVHIRKSNTEPILRIYTEAPSQDEADTLNAKFKEIITNFTLNSH